jgi:hypothetical protein
MLIYRLTDILFSPGKVVLFMSTDTLEKQSKGGNKKGFLSKLPSNLPFVPVIRRPDYQLRRLRLRMPKNIPTAIIITLIFTGLFFVYIGGFYYMTTDDLRTTYPDPLTGDPTFIWKTELNEQTIAEGVAAGILMLTGASGFYLIHYSTHYSYSQNHATKLMLIGLVLTIFALAGLARLLYIKLWQIEDLIKSGRA